MTTKPLMLLCAVLFLPLGGRASAEAVDPAASQVHTLTAALLKSMQAGSAESMTDRYRDLEPVIKQVFALPLVTALSVGPQWASFSQDQQNALIEAFTRFTVANYAHNFRSYAGERIEVDDNVSSRGQDKIVRSKIVLTHDNPVNLLYRMRDVDAAWKIIDVYSEGVSELALHRTDFTEAIAAGGAPVLIAHLNKVSDDLLK